MGPVVGGAPARRDHLQRVAGRDAVDGAAAHGDGPRRTPRRAAERGMMDEDRAAFWAKVMLLALAVTMLLTVVDHKLKNDIVAEAKALREEMARVRRGEASPADQAGRGG